MKKIKIIKLLLLIVLLHKPIFAMEELILNMDKYSEFWKKHKNFLEEIGKFGAEATENLIKAAQQALESDEKKFKTEIKNLDIQISKIERNRSHSKEFNEKRILLLEQKKMRLENKIEKLRDEHNENIKKIRDIAYGGAEQIKKSLLDNWLNKAKRKEQMIAEIVKEQEVTKTRVKTTAKEWTKPKRLKVLSFAAVGTASGLTTCYYGGKLTARYIESKMGRPNLIRESSILGWKQNLSNFWKYTILGLPQKKITLEDVILEAKTKQILDNFAHEIKSIYKNNLPFRNSLFYGLPGTGKTMSAVRIAKFCNMDYAIISGADFSQFKGGEAIIELHKLFDWAKRSNRGLIVFIDEADSFLRDRRMLNNIERNLLNAFLSRTGTSSVKIMFIFSTNYEDELDPAVLSRIHKKIYFPLPKIEERIKIFNLYFEKYVINDVRTIIKDKQKIKMSIEVPKDVNQIFIKEICEKMKGFSGRELEQLVSEFRSSAYNIGQGTLTKKIINDAVTQKIKEHNHDMLCRLQQRKRYEKLLGSSVISMQENNTEAIPN